MAATQLAAETAPRTAAGAGTPRTGAPPASRDQRPSLRLIEGGRDRLERRRRIARDVLVAFAGLVLIIVLWATYTVAGAMSSSRTVETGGTAVVAPGETLWDVAVTHAPEGVDPRSYLEDLRHLNGGSAVEPWTVVDLPAQGPGA